MMECVPAEDVAVELVGREEGVRWSARTESLNVNLMAWNAGHVVEEHVNTVVDVLLVVLGGRGELLVDGDTVHLAAGLTVTIPRGASRAIEARERLVYLTVHRLRPGLMPQPLR